MLNSHHLIFWLAALLAVPVVTVFVLNRAFRSQGGIARGWGGAMFIALAWMATMAAILQRVAS